MQREINYKFFVENVNAEEYLKRLEYEVDRFEKNKDSMEEFVCWIGWNNFWIEYSDDPTMNLVTFLLLPAVQPTKLIGCIRAENSGIEIEYYFKKTEKYQKRIFYLSVFGWIFIGIGWLNELGKLWSGLERISITSIIGLLIFTLYFVLLNIRAKKIPKLHVNKLTELMYKAISNTAFNK